MEMATRSGAPSNPSNWIPALLRMAMRTLSSVLLIARTVSWPLRKATSGGTGGGSASYIVGWTGAGCGAAAGLTAGAAPDTLPACCAAGAGCGVKPSGGGSGDQGSSRCGWGGTTRGGRGRRGAGTVCVIGCWLFATAASSSNVIHILRVRRITNGTAQMLRCLVGPYSIKSYSFLLRTGRERILACERA